MRAVALPMAVRGMWLPLVVAAAMHVACGFQTTHLKPWKVAAAAGFKGYSPTADSVNVTAPGTCDALLSTTCMSKDPGLVRRRCGQVPDTPVVDNGVQRVFKFYACLAGDADDSWCHVAGIRGEYLCAEFTSMDPPQYTTCTCWGRRPEASADSRVPFHSHRRQATRHRIQTDADDGTHVFLDQAFDYVTRSGVLVATADNYATEVPREVGPNPYPPPSGT